MENLITFGYYASSLGFLVATVFMYLAVEKFGKSTLGSTFMYLCIGTGIFFVITVFQTLGGDFFGIGYESMDVWWHVMFYLALFFYFHCVKVLVNLGSTNTESSSMTVVKSEKIWWLSALVILIIIFLIPRHVDNVVLGYDSSPLGQLGLHHFLSFIFAGWVGSYLLNAKRNLGQIGRAISGPMIIALWAFAIQHLWELLTESWKVFIVSDYVIEGVERLFLLVAAVSIVYAALRLKSFAKM